MEKGPIGWLIPKKRRTTGKTHPRAATSVVDRARPPTRALAPGSDAQQAIIVGRPAWQRSRGSDDVRGAQGMSIKSASASLPVGSVPPLRGMTCSVRLAPFCCTVLFPPGNETTARLAAFAKDVTGFLMPPAGATMFGRASVIWRGGSSRLSSPKRWIEVRKRASRAAKRSGGRSRSYHAVAPTLSLPDRAITEIGLLRSAKMELSPFTRQGQTPLTRYGARADWLRTQEDPARREMAASNLARLPMAPPRKVRTRKSPRAIAACR